jgi:hypothetical protein
MTNLKVCQYRRRLGVVILIASGLLAAGAQAQEKLHRNSVNFTLGYLHHLNQDFLASPFRYGGSTVPLALTYDYAGFHNRHHLQFSLAHLTMHSALSGTLGPESHESEYISLTMRYAFARYVTSIFSESWRVYAGGAWDNVFSFRNYSYAPSLEDETIAEVFSMLSLFGEAEHHITAKQRLCASLSCALFGYAFRNPYGLASDRIAAIATYHSYLRAFTQLAKFTALNKLLFLQGVLTYDLALSSRFDLQANCRLSYCRFAEPRTSTSFDNDLTMGISFKF